MGTFSYRAPVPNTPELFFAGNTFEDARLDYIAFHGGIVAVQHDIAATPGMPSLSRAEEIALGMNSVGMSRAEISIPIDRSEPTVTKRLQDAYRKLDPSLDGRAARVASVGLAFACGIFETRFGITSEEERPHDAFFEHIMSGRAFDAYQSPPSANDLSGPRSRDNEARRRLDISSIQSFLFYSHLAGWLPLETHHGGSSGN